eukprot:11742571-Alexandrium_andersonii.AAC.1
MRRAGKWADVSKQLTAARNSSSIGEKLFGHAASLVAGEQLVAAIEEEVSKLGHGKITSERYQQLSD